VLRYRQTGVMPLMDEPSRTRPHVLNFWKEDSVSGRGVKCGEPPHSTPHSKTALEGVEPWLESSGGVALGLADPGTSQRSISAIRLEALTATLQQELRQRARHLSGAQIAEGGDAKRTMEEGTTMEAGCDSKCVAERSVS